MTSSLDMSSFLDAWLRLYPRDVPTLLSVEGLGRLYCEAAAFVIDDVVADLRRHADGAIAWIAKRPEIIAAAGPAIPSELRKVMQAYMRGQLTRGKAALEVPLE